MPGSWFGKLALKADLREKSKPKDGINTEELNWIEIEPPEAQFRLMLNQLTRPVVYL